MTGAIDAQDASLRDQPGQFVGSEQPVAIAIAGGEKFLIVCPRRLDNLRQTALGLVCAENLAPR